MWYLPVQVGLHVPSEILARDEVSKQEFRMAKAAAVMVAAHASVE